MEITENSLFEVLSDQAEMETGNIKSIKEWREWLLEALSNSLDADQQELRNEIIKASPEDIYKELNEYRGLTTTKPGEVEEAVNKFNQIADTIKNEGIMKVDSPAIGEIDFPCGIWGDLTRHNTGGFGIKHIIQGRHEKDKLNVDEISTLLFLTQNILEQSEHYTLTSSSNRDRLLFEKDDIVVVVAKSWYNEQKNWIVTGFGKYDEEGKLTRAATDAIKTGNAKYSYALDHSYVREQVGAVVRSIDNIRQNMDSVNTNQEIYHIPETQELSVEEINAYLEKYDFRLEHDEVRHDLSWAGFLYKDINNINSKDKLFNFLTNQQKNFSEKEWLNNFVESRKGYGEEGKLSIKEEKRDVEYFQKDLCAMISDFDQKFDKCMAEFHAKQPNPNVDLGHGRVRVQTKRPEGVQELENKEIKAKGKQI